MATTNLNYGEAKNAVIQGHSVTRPSWGNCKKIRPYVESDADFIDVGDTSELIVEDCERKECDCRIGIWVPVEDDRTAADYLIITT